MPRLLGLETQFQKECRQVWILDSLAFWKEERTLIGLAFPLRSQSSGLVVQEQLAYLFITTENQQFLWVTWALDPGSKTSILRGQKKFGFLREASSGSCTYAGSAVREWRLSAMVQFSLRSWCCSGILGRCSLA